MNDRIETANRLVEQLNESESEADRKRLRQELVVACSRLVGRPVKVVAYPWRMTYQTDVDPETGGPLYRSVDARSTMPIEYPNNNIRAVDGATERIFINPSPVEWDPDQSVWHEILAGSIVSISEPDTNNNELGEAS